MLVETDDLVSPRNAAHLAGLDFARFQAQVNRGQIKAFVVIDGQAFYHRAEVLALRRHTETMEGKRPSRPLPRMQDLF